MFFLDEHEWKHDSDFAMNALLLALMRIAKVIVDIYYYIQNNRLHSKTAQYIDSCSVRFLPDFCPEIFTSFQKFNCVIIFTQGKYFLTELGLLRAYQISNVI